MKIEYYGHGGMLFGTDRHGFFKDTAFGSALI